ncbi:MAG: alpha/beta hydrolase [Ignavibacteriae bacterium]|nr:alpha/beta hydrolase [Ignavibacteriota bacterium]
MPTLIIILVYALPTAHTVRAQSWKHPQVELRGTEVRTIHSKAVDGMEYKIFIGLPDNYSSSSDTYPALYFLDGWNQFGILVETYRLLRLFNDIPPLVLIGISWEGDEKAHVYNRARDYIPTHLSQHVLAERFGQDYADLFPASGGAPKFLAFIQDELIPFVEREYRIDTTSRGIFGHSAGGLFTAWLLFTRPELFQKYLIGSAALWWDDDYVFKQEAEYRAAHDSLTARIFVTVGSEEGEWLVTSWAKLKDRLQYRQYAGLNVTTMMFEGETHSSVIPGTYSRALRVLYGY